MKKLISLFTLLFSSVATFAQTEPSSASILDSPMLMFYIVVGFVFVVVVLVILVALYMLQVLNFMVKQATRERAERLGIPYKEQPSFWAKLWKESNDFSPIENEADITMKHTYDGIRELDNHLPPWWKWLFYGSIVFSGVYFVVYHMSDTLPLPLKEYENELALADEQARKLKASSPTAVIDENTVQLVTDANALADGKTTFLNNCASCHRKDGGGDIGPNLTDEYWKHGGSIQDIFKVVRHGVQATNMIAWEGFISPEKMQNVSSYILTLQGSSPENAKKPEGELYKPDATQPSSDSVKVQASL
ncbi:MAG TPA: cbb3-type cytochrome c oxidase N-terminal domain-containing protein [Cyclobacteriaceae bacterium]|jgi:cytochrome c oxidase cbb3-type subunit 3|nr:c-type cytochrome [Cytophagales bacterium]HRE68028.1 cbb3-type cytochrome c oxidase N-terminal domain-containing protein [Cyclobacteriaceae bacterium]HRF35163.1 cbb3-type cytochrome c oxidase N-terminal domain-containing protein [Cyclobacteriaceae bacterium]